MGKTMGNLITWFLVLLLTAQAIWTATHSNFTLGMVLVIALAAAAWVLKLFHQPLWSFVQGTLLGKILLMLISLGLLLVLGLVAFVVVSGYSSQPTGEEQVMVVLGGGLRRDKPSAVLAARLDLAYEYWLEHPELLVVVTGGQGRDELCPEGQAMKKYLVEKGIPEEQVIDENASTSTEENFAFSRLLLEERDYSTDTPVVVVTNAFHCYRGREYARMAGFTMVTSLPASIPVTAILPCYLREAFALLYYWVFKSSRTGIMHQFVGILETGKKNLLFKI